MALLIKKARRSLLKKWSMLIGCALGILGGSTCEDSATEDDIMKPAYGVPTNYYFINGTVKSSDANTSISGIKLTPDKLGSEALSYTDGYYSVKLNLDNSDAKDQTITLKAEDIDGATNGSYLGKSVIIDIKATDYVGGYFVKNIDILLDPVK
jgi:putative lipoprotein (rSAM/lipoprotein system)